MVGRKHKSFLSESRFLDGGVVNVMGQHGEIGRGFYSRKIGPIHNRAQADDYERHLMDILMSRMPPFTKRKHHDAIYETLRTAFRQAKQYDLEGPFCFKQKTAYEI